MATSVVVAINGDTDANNEMVKVVCCDKWGEREGGKKEAAIYFLRLSALRSKRKPRERGSAEETRRNRLWENVWTNEQIVILKNVILSQVEQNPLLIEPISREFVAVWRTWMAGKSTLTIAASYTRKSVSKLGAEKILQEHFDS